MMGGAAGDPWPPTTEPNVSTTTHWPPTTEPNVSATTEQNLSTTVPLPPITRPNLSATEGWSRHHRWTHPFREFADQSAYLPISDACLPPPDVRWGAPSTCFDDCSMPEHNQWLDVVFQAPALALRRALEAHWREEGITHCPRPYHVWLEACVVHALCMSCARRLENAVGDIGCPSLGSDSMEGVERARDGVRAHFNRLADDDEGTASCPSPLTSAAILWSQLRVRSARRQRLYCVGWRATLDPNFPIDALIPAAEPSKSV